MPIFRTLADYDKWRRRMLIERLQRLERIDNVQADSSSGDFQPLPSQPIQEQTAEPTAEFESDPISKELLKGLSPVSMKSSMSERLGKGADNTQQQFNPKNQGPSPKLDKGTKPKPIKDDGPSKPLKDGTKPKPVAPSSGGGGGGGGSGGTQSVSNTPNWVVQGSEEWQVNGDTTTPLTDPTNKFTFACWFNKGTSTPTTSNMMFDQDTSGSRLASINFRSSGVIQVLMDDTVGFLICNLGSSTTPLMDGSDHHVCVTASEPDDEITIYVDGTQYGTTTWAASAGNCSPVDNLYVARISSSETASIIKPGSEFAQIYCANEFIASAADVNTAFYADGAGVDGGEDGSGHTGTVPWLYLNSDNAADWNAGVNQSSTDGDVSIVSGGAVTMRA